MQKHRRAATNAKPVRTYAPAPYTGTGTEVVDALTSDTTIPASRLLAVAAWHEQKYGRRHGAIAAKLREVAVNDNRPVRA